MNTETNLADGPEVEDVLDTEDEGSTEEVAEDNPVEGDEESDDTPEDEEVELDEGLKLTVPKDVAQKLKELKEGSLRQADYTRKTQELAADRKELAALKESVQQAGEAEVNARARVVAIDAALKQYDTVNWGELQARDPNAALSHWMQYQQLRDAKGEAETEYTSAVEARGLETQQQAAKRIEEGIAELQRDIPGWSIERASQLTAFGVEQFGFTRDYLEGIDDPKVIKMLNYAFLAAKQKPTQQAQPALKPAAKVKGGNVPRKGLDDRLSTEEWLKERNRQVAARRQSRA